MPSGRAAAPPSLSSFRGRPSCVAAGGVEEERKNVRKNYAYDPPYSLLNFPGVCQELLRLLTRTHHPPPPDRELNLAEVSITVSRWKREEEEEKKIPLWCQKRYAQKKREFFRRERLSSLALELY